MMTLAEPPSAHWQGHVPLKAGASQHVHCALQGASFPASAGHRHPDRSGSWLTGRLPSSEQPGDSSLVSWQAAPCVFPGFRETDVQFGTQPHLLSPLGWSWTKRSPPSSAQRQTRLLHRWHGCRPSAQPPALQQKGPSHAWAHHTAGAAAGQAQQSSLPKDTALSTRLQRIVKQALPPRKPARPSVSSVAALWVIARAVTSGEGT